MACDNWIASLGDDQQRLLDLVLVDMWQRADFLEKKSQECAPVNGIPIGSDYVRYHALAESLRLFYHSVFFGMNLDDARNRALERSRLYAKNHNRKREWQVHIWEGFGESEIDRWWRALEQIKNGAA